MGKTYKDNPQKWRKFQAWKPKPKKGKDQRLTEQKDSVNYRHDDSSVY